MILLLVALVARAEEPVPVEAEAPVPRQLIALVGSGGYDLATRQPFAAIEATFHHDGDRGFAFEGRVQAGWGFFDQRPLVRVEAGFLGVVPAKQVVRLGFVGGTGLFAAPFAAPLQVPGPPDEGDWAALSFLPYGALATELGGVGSGKARAIATWAVGLRLGATVGIGALAGCGDDQTPLETCSTPRVGFYGGLTARARFRNGAFLDLLAGPTSHLGVGYAF